MGPSLKMQNPQLGVRRGENVKMLSSGVPRPRVSTFQSSVSSFPCSSSPFLLFWSRSFPARPFGVRETWEEPQELLRDGETHTGALPQSLLSQRQSCLLNTPPYMHILVEGEEENHELTEMGWPHKMCLNVLQGGE